MKTELCERCNDKLILLETETSGNHYRFLCYSCEMLHDKYRPYADPNKDLEVYNCLCIIKPHPSIKIYHKTKSYYVTTVALHTFFWDCFRKKCYYIIEPPGGDDTVITLDWIPTTTSTERINKIVALL